MAVAERLWAVDLDRTLLDTNASFNLLVRVCEQRGVDRPALEVAKYETENSGGSFGVFKYLEQIGMSAGEVEGLTVAFANAGSGADLLYPDTRPFLAVIDEHRIQNLIVTYGDPNWQGAKLSASGLETRAHLITEQKYKGELIAGLATRLGFYRVSSSAGRLLAGKTVSLIDDKALSFRGLPEDCDGHWLRRRGEAAIPSQAGEVPANVALRASLTEIMELVA